MTSRTDLQRDADRIDCDLYRILDRVELLQEEEHGYRASRALALAARALRIARAHIRSNMHEDDRAVTV